MTMRTAPSMRSIPAPSCPSASFTAPMWAGSAPSQTMSPPVAAAAAMNVPVSMRSGMIRQVVPSRRSTPSITRRWPPMPSIFAPHAIRK